MYKTIFAILYNLIDRVRVLVVYAYILVEYILAIKVETEAKDYLDGIVKRIE